MKKVLFVILGLVFIIFNNQAQTVTDIDGNVYNTITIGTQVWMKENLKVTHYNNGDIIQNVVDTSTWFNLSNGANGALCYYNNDSATNASVFGALYNWYAVVDNRNICPTNWHVPSDTNWHSLALLLDLSSQYTIGFESTIAGGKMKSVDTVYWNSPNVGATNESNFTALPGGIRDLNGNYFDKRNSSNYWTSTPNSISSAYNRHLFYNSTNLIRSSGKMTYGYSIRCICDFSVNVINHDYNNGLSISPNPFSQSTQITLPQTYHIISLAVYDIQGKLVAQNQYKDCSQIQFNRNQLSNGLYFLKLTLDDKEVETGKIVISE